MKKRILLASIFIIISFGSYSQGLQFKSYDFEADLRTSYNVFAKQPPVFNDKFSIEFDLLINSFNSFGYVFRVIDEISGGVYNLAFSNFDENKSYLKFAIAGKETLIQIEIDNNLQKQRWIRVAVDFFLDKNSVEITVGNQTIRKNIKEFTNQIKPSILFGKTHFSIEVPEISIRNLLIHDNKTSYEFPLFENKGSDVHDVSGRVFGKVENAVWLINDSFYWKHRYTESSKTPSGIIFSEKNQEFILFKNDSLILYSLLTNQRESHAVNIPIDIRLGTSFLDDHRGILYIYEINGTPQGNPTMVAIDINSFDCKVVSTVSLPHQRHHHNGFFDPKTNKYTIFGGFGNQEFKGNFKEYDIESNLWSDIVFDGDHITPRFFAGGGSLNDRYYIFGGVGNSTGEQSQGTTTSYDLYEIDLATKKIAKLWELENNGTNLVSVRDMIVDPNGHFYTLRYPSYKSHCSLELHQFSIANGDMVVLGDSIPMSSNDIRTNANLWFNERQKQFYCTIEEFTKDNNSTVRIYSIAAPPISYEQLHSMVAQRNGWIYFLAVAICTLSFILLLLMRRNKRTKSVDSLDSAILEVQQSLPVDNLVMLFGNFKVVDRMGVDISHLFGFKLKQLFALLLITTNQGGVTSSEIYEVLWPEKATDKAKNLKGVMLVNLKKIFHHMSGIELIFQDGLYSISHTSQLYCDYCVLVELLEQHSRAETLNGTELSLLLSVIERGVFLLGMENDYIDNYKQKQEGEILNIVTYQIKHRFHVGHYGDVIQFANALFVIDPLSELAMCYYIHSKERLGLGEQAKKRYAKFVVAHKQTLNEEYQYSYAELSQETMLDSF